MNDKLVAFLGEKPHTLLNVALEETQRGLGCLPVLEPQPIAHTVEG